MLAQADSAAFEAGQAIGRMVALVIPLLVLVIAIKRLSEPKNSRMCALALLLAAIGWLVSGLLALAVKWAPGLRLPAFLAAVSSIGAALGAVVLAVLGFLELSRRRDLVQGRGQAIGALLIAALLLGGAAYGASQAAGGVPEDWKMRQPTAGSRLPFPGKNYTFAVPGGGWVQVPTAKINERADVAFARPKENIFFMVISHPVEPGAVPSLDLLAEASRQELTGIDPQAKVEAAAEEAIGPLAGKAFVGDARVNGQRFTYRYWVGTTPTHLYSLITFGEQKSRAKVIAAAKDVVKNFAVTPP